MLRVLIIDDEPPARARLKRLLERVPGCELAGEGNSARQALDLLETAAVDVLLLDISMPGLDGMSLARKLARLENPPSVVFCTAWADQALEAFECDAVDYLVKPVRRERLEGALDKVARLRGKTLTDEDAYLRSVVAGRTLLISVEDVICLLAEDKYTTVFYDGGETVINNSLVELEKRFGNRFLRVHRNALVSVNRIRGLDSMVHGPVTVQLEGSSARPEVSRRHLPAVRKLVRSLG